MISLLLLFYDIITINLAYLVALWLRFDCRFSLIPEHYLETATKIIPIYTVVMLIALASMRLYRSVWRYASVPELVRVFLASVIGAVTQVVVTLSAMERMPISYYMIGWILMFAALAVSRFGYRAARMLYREKRKKNHQGKNVMIIGAGEAGKELLDELLRSNRLNVNPKCFIDDDVNKHGKYMSDIPIVGGRNEIIAASQKYEFDLIILAIPTLNT